MTKDEARLAVMGAISMALKDPILQQGFEIICKENTELKAQIEKMKADVRVNIKVADQSNNCLMYQKLNSMLNQWEGKRR